MRAYDLREGAKGLGLNLEGIALPTYLGLSSSGGAERDSAGPVSDGGQAGLQAWLKPDDSSGCDLFLIECPQQARDRTKKN